MDAKPRVTVSRAEQPHDLVANWAHCDRISLPGYPDETEDAAQRTGIRRTSAFILTRKGMLVAQISDPHVLAPGKLFHAPEKAVPRGAGPNWSRIDTAACLARAVVELNALAPRPDVAVVTGDLVEHGSTAEYEHLRVLLATLVIPFFVIPGNNDSREGMREAFGSEGYLPRAGFLHYAIEQYPLRIVALDTHIPGEHGGLPCAERLAWFDSALAAAPKLPTVVLMHHPAFATGIAHMDRYGLRDTAAFGEIVSRNRQIECIVCGRLHRAIDRRFAGTVAGTAPSTAHQVLLDLEPEAPL